MGSSVFGIDLVEESADQSASIVDGHEETVLPPELDRELRRQEETVEPADLLGADRMADSEEVPLGVLIGDHHFAVAPATCSGGNEQRFVLRSKVGVGQAGEERIVVLVEAEIGPEVGNGCAQFVAFEVPGSQASDDLLQSFGQLGWCISKYGFPEETGTRLRETFLQGLKSIGRVDFLECRCGRKGCCIGIQPGPAAESFGGKEQPSWEEASLGNRSKKLRGLSAKTLKRRQRGVGQCLVE